MSVPALNRPALSVVPDRSVERTVDADVYRSVFRRHAAGVVVITTDAGHGPVGFTATSLVSISLLPPLVSFAIATSGIDRFAEPTRWSRLPTGEPVLDDAPSFLRAQIAHRFAVGDHYLVVARLATHTERREHESLLYHDGRYAKAHHV